MNPQFDDQSNQPKYKKVWNYLKRTFYYEFYTYNIPKSTDAVALVLLTYFKKLDDNRIVRKIYGEMPDEDSLYMQYISRGKYSGTGTSYIFSPTCLKGRLYSSKGNNTIIEIAVRADSKYLGFFLISLIGGITWSYNLYKQNNTDILFLLPIIVGLIAAIIITKVVAAEKASIKENFEEVIGQK